MRNMAEENLKEAVLKAINRKKFLGRKELVSILEEKGFIFLDEYANHLMNEFHMAALADAITELLKEDKISLRIPFHGTEFFVGEAWLRHCRRTKRKMDKITKK